MATNHNQMLFFTEKAKYYKLKVYEISECAKNSKGRAIQNLLDIESDDRVNACIRIKDMKNPEFRRSHYLVFCTNKGIIKKPFLDQYSNTMTKGIKAINLLEGDNLINVALTNGNCEIMIADRLGQAVKFHENRVRPMGRVSTGVRGMKLGGATDEVIGMIILRGNENESVMVVSANGYGKRSVPDSYRLSNRGVKGVKTLNITEKTGELVAIQNVNDDNDLMIINKSGIVLRLAVADIRIQGRATQGVKLIDLTKRGDEIASVCKVNADPGKEAPSDDDIEGNVADTGEPENEENVTEEVVSVEIEETDISENDSPSADTEQ